jgi:O-acetyl-ADP-ribose deacetylase (regulator of RNase III)
MSVRRRLTDAVLSGRYTEVRVPGPGQGPRDILASRDRRSLQVASTLGAGARSVAFPAIAAGIYGFPPDQAARIAVDIIRSTHTAVECERLMVIGQLACDILEAALDA